MRAGIDPLSAEELELWKLAAACNLDLIESVEQRNLREMADERSEIYEEEYWQTKEGMERMERMKARAGKRKRSGR